MGGKTNKIISFLLHVGANRPHRIPRIPKPWLTFHFGLERKISFSWWNLLWLCCTHSFEKCCKIFSAAGAGPRGRGAFPLPLWPLFLRPSFPQNLADIVKVLVTYQSLWDWYNLHHSPPSEHVKHRLNYRKAHGWEDQDLPASLQTLPTKLQSLWQMLWSSSRPVFLLLYAGQRLFFPVMLHLALYLRVERGQFCKFFFPLYIIYQAWPMWFLLWLWKVWQICIQNCDLLPKLPGDGRLNPDQAAQHLPIQDQHHTPFMVPRHSLHTYKYL